MIRRICIVVALIGCGAPRGRRSPRESAAAATAAPSGTSRDATDCEWRLYFAPAGCYVDDSFDGPVTIADEAGLARALRRLPEDPHVRHPPCDPATEAARFDFSRHRLFFCKAPGDGRPTEPLRVECRDDGTHVVVPSQAAAQCGHGDEVGTSPILLVLPAGAAPVVRVEEGRCDSGPGDPPA